MSLLPGQQRTDTAMERGAIAAVLGRYSLDVSAGCDGRHSTLLDEYERLAFEAQLNRAILRRSYSEPSPARSASAEAPPVHRAEESAGRGLHELAGTFWRLGEVVSRWLETLKPILGWLRTAWDGREGRAAPCPPAMPRVQLLDYFR